MNATLDFPFFAFFQPNLVELALETLLLQSDSLLDLPKVISFWTEHSEIKIDRSNRSHLIR